MRLSRSSLPGRIVFLGLVAAPAVGFLLLTATPGLDGVVRAPVQHFYVVSTVSVLALVLSIMAGIASLRLENPRALFLALGFMGMTAAFTLHGLATPGFLLEAEYAVVTGFAARLSLLLVSLFMAASAVRLSAGATRFLIRWRKPILVGSASAMLLAVLVALGAPDLIPAGLITSAFFLDSSTALVVMLAAFAAYRYAASYRRSGLGAYAAFCAGAIFIVEAQLTMHFGRVWTIGWWLYHLQLLAGFSAMTWAFFHYYARGETPLQVVEALTAQDPLVQIRLGYSEAIVAFAASLEARDGYTIGHGERVSALAVLMGVHLRLGPERLRALGRGALLHDVGKIGIPDRVLHLPGKLDADDFNVIKGHPVHGAAIIATVSSDPLELAIVRHHHEWFDGSGYPDRLASEQIPLEAKITAVADVYDALRSARAYRGPWSMDAALGLIQDEATTHFDPRCVGALLAVVHQWESEYADTTSPYAERRYG